ncbi:MAG TPA: hypothetical protein VG452_01930 [Egibacteraceae bacterium]|nr:hypothetical protein [Egibacteraceae bacterium]
MTGAVWVASYLLLWLAVVVLSFAVVVLLRQIGVLHARLRPLGVQVADEGLPAGAPAPASTRLAYGQAPLTLVAFVSQTCALCDALLPSLAAVERQYADVALRVVTHGSDTADLFGAFNVRSTPYLVAVDRAGTVRGGGIANTLEQVELLIEAAGGRPPATASERPGARRPG